MPDAAACAWMAQERLVLGLVRGDDQLAAAPVLDAARLGVAVEELLALDAGPRLQAARRVVDAGVDHLAVARAGLGADRVGALEDDDLAPGRGQPLRDREPDDAGPDDDAVDAVQRQSPADRASRSARVRPRLSAAARMSDRLLSSIGIALALAQQLAPAARARPAAAPRRSPCAGGEALIQPLTAATSSSIARRIAERLRVHQDRAHRCSGCRPCARARAGWSGRRSGRRPAART